MLYEETGPLWCLQIDGALITAQLEHFGCYGIEVRLLWDGRIYFAEIYPTREQALMTSEQLRIGYVASTTLQ